MVGQELSVCWSTGMVKRFTDSVGATMLRMVAIDAELTAITRSALSGATVAERLAKAAPLRKELAELEQKLAGLDGSEKKALVQNRMIALLYRRPALTDDRVGARRVAGPRPRAVEYTGAESTIPEMHYVARQPTKKACSGAIPNKPLGVQPTGDILSA